MLAHIIRNRTTSVAEGACAVHATNRWAITGTPIQNKLTDLASIFEFLQVYPFCSALVFKHEILRPWQSSDPKGFMRLNTLIGYIVLCRDKDAIELPPRVDETRRLDFSAAESALYDSTKLRTARLLDVAIAKDFTQRGTYLNALQWLNTLRLICNHGVMHPRRGMFGSTMGTAGGIGTWNIATAQKAFESLLYAGAAVCAGCSMDLLGATNEPVIVPSTKVTQSRLSECLFLVCGPCLLRQSRDLSDAVTCSHTPVCQAVEVSIPGNATSSQSMQPVPALGPAEVPTKLQALLTDLQDFPEEKRYFVHFIV